MQQSQATTEWMLQQCLDTATCAECATIAQLWGLTVSDASLDDLDNRSLAAVLLTPAAVDQMLSTLTDAEQTALKQIQAAGGMILSTVLERSYGSIRPHHNYPNPRSYLLALKLPPSTTERLFLLGLIQPARHAGQSVYIIPTDLRPLLPPVPPHDSTLHLTPDAEPPVAVAANIWELEYNLIVLLTLAGAGELIVATGRGINKASLVRLARRWGMSKDDLRGLTYEQHWHYVHFLRLVLQGAGMLRVNADQELRPTTAVETWLQAPRLERLQRLLDGWVTSEWDELTRLLHIELRGSTFDRNLAATHRAVLDILAQVPPGTWIAWDTLLDEVLRACPDFARPAGNYHNWQLVDYQQRSLDGFEHWREVEGELLKAMIGGSLGWLGLVDYGGVKNGEQRNLPIAFRLNALGAALLNGDPPPAEPDYAPLIIQGTFEIIVPPHSAPYTHFQLSRIATWLSGYNVDEATVYRLTKASVQAALDQGIDLTDMIRFLEQASGAPLPANVAYSLHEWSGQHGQLTLRPVAVLQAEDPLLLAQLQHDRRLRLPPFEALNAHTWLFNVGDAATFATALRKVGYGVTGDVEQDGGPFKERDLTLLAAAIWFYARACPTLGVDSDVSAALLQRVTRLLNERQRSTADRLAREALQALRGAMKQD